MSTKKTQTKDAQAQPSPNGPDFIAYQVIDLDDKNDQKRKPIWRKIGSAWMHSDGNGIQVRLDAFPVGGVVTLRIPLPDEDEAAA